MTGRGKEAGARQQLQVGSMAEQQQREAGQFAAAAATAALAAGLATGLGASADLQQVRWQQVNQQQAMMQVSSSIPSDQLAAAGQYRIRSRAT